MLPLANIFQPLIDVANSVLTFFHDNLGVSWGISIILLTIVTRLLILPLSLKQIRSMRALQAHQPESKKIQEKYKDDRRGARHPHRSLLRDHGRLDLDHGDVGRGQPAPDDVRAAGPLHAVRDQL